MIKDCTQCTIVISSKNKKNLAFHSSAGGDSNVSSNGGQGPQGQGGGCQLPTPTVRTVKAGETLILVGEVKSGKSYLRLVST